MKVVCIILLVGLAAIPSGSALPTNDSVAAVTKGTILRKFGIQEKYGGDSACTVHSPCGVGQGDCDTDAQCMGESKCGTDNCNLKQTTFTSGDDCCYVNSNFKYGGHSSCTTSSQCSVGQGDCDKDSECKGSAKCGTDNCDVSKGTFADTSDCCYPVFSQTTFKWGGDSSCTTSSPCSAGQGDCDYDTECIGSLKCGENNCDQSKGTFTAGDDCCFGPFIHSHSP